MLLRVSSHRFTLLQKCVWLVRALANVIAIRIGLTMRRSDAIRASIVANAPATSPQPWEMRLTAWSVAKAASVVPYASCLTQAFAGQRMLARRGRQSMVRISIPVGERKTLEPHAWLVWQDRIILGGGPDLFARHRTLLHYRSDSMTPIPAPAPASLGAARPDAVSA